MRNKRVLLIVCCCIIMCMGLTGCKAQSGSGSNKKVIKVNSVKSEMVLTNVTYYDFVDYKLMSNRSESCYLLSNAGSTTIEFLDGNGAYRAMKVDVAPNKRPSKLKVYTNSTETEYETYNCSY